MQILETVDGVRCAIGKRRIVFEGPALLFETGYGVGDGNGVFQLLERAKDQRAVRPGAAVGNIEVITPGLRLEPGRPVRGNAIAKSAVGALEFTAAAGFLRQLLIAPYAFDQNTHIHSSRKRVSTASSRLLHDFSRQQGAPRRRRLMLSGQSRPARRAIAPMPPLPPRDTPRRRSGPARSHPPRRSVALGQGNPLAFRRSRTLRRTDRPAHPPPARPRASGQSPARNPLPIIVRPATTPFVPWLCAARAPSNPAAFRRSLFWRAGRPRSGPARPRRGYTARYRPAETGLLRVPPW